MSHREEFPPNLRDAFDAFLAGDLDPAAERRFLAAALEDPALAAEVARFRELADEIHRLPQELEPERDLWPGIEARTVARATPSRWRWLAIGLAAGLLLAVAAALLLERRAGPGTSPAGFGSAAAGGAERAAPALAAYAESGKALAAIRGELRREAELRARDLPPATRTIVFENLATIERAIAEIEAALAERPDDPALARTYIAYRQREIDLLRRVNRAASRL